MHMTLAVNSQLPDASQTSFSVWTGKLAGYRQFNVLSDCVGLLHSGVHLRRVMFRKVQGCSVLVKST